MSPCGVGFLFLSCLTIGGGVGSLTLSTVLFGGETLQSPPHGGGAGGGHPQDMFRFFSLVVIIFNFFRSYLQILFKIRLAFIVEKF